MTRRASEIRSGARVNALGLAGKLAAPAFLILVNRLYGVDVFGVYVTAVSLIEMGIAILTAGFRDAALLYVARHSDDDSDRSHPELYRSLANALAWGLSLSALLIATTLTAGETLVPRFFPDFGSRLLVMLQWMVLVLPLMAFERIVLGATQGLKIMRYEAAINGFARPILLVAFAVLLWLVKPTELGLVLAFIATQGTVALIAIWIFGRELSWRALARAIRAFRPDRELVLFALPQNLNRTLERFITSIDVVMLGMFGFSASAVGLYGAGALIVRELRHVKMIFSTAFAPHIVQLHSRQRREELSVAFSITSRWIAQWMLPLLLLVAILRGDLLALVHPDFGGEDTRFMLVLLVIPYLQAALGLAGNVVVMTGHSSLNLFNSVVAATTNVLLNLLWIPAFGALGAALASATAAVATTLLATGEMVLVVRSRPIVREMITPHIAGVMSAASVVVVATFGGYEATSLAARITIAVSAVAVYYAAIRLLQAMGLGTSDLSRAPREETKTATSSDPGPGVSPDSS